MKLLSSLRVKKQKLPLLVGLGLVFVFASFINLVTPLAPTANALTKTEQATCFQRFNGKEINYSRLSQADKDLHNKCIGYCTYAGPGAEIDSKKMSCPDPAEPSSEAEAAANDAETKPLVTATCGTVPTSGENAINAWLRCQYQVRTIYYSCSSTGGGVTGSGQDTPQNTAACAVPKINALPGITKITVNSAITLITQGRKEHDVITTNNAVAKAKADCEAQGGTWANTECTPKSDTDAPVCSAGALGWVICPLSEFMQNSTKLIAEQLQKYLTFEPIIGSTSGKAIQAVWQSLLVISNVVLVIALIIVIYSQATSAGLSNYGVKKMLPKLMVVAILMNLSFFICAIAVDASNIAGASIKGLVDAGFAALPAPPAGTQVGATNAQTGVAVVVGGISLVAASAAGLLPLLFPVLATAALTLLAALAIVVFRQVAIVILIILAPLAFAAYLLPNTESWFKKWQKAFTTLLFIYPIIMAIFYGSALVSRLIMTTTDAGGAGAGVMTQIIALAVLVVPLFSLPFILKSAGGVLDRFGALVNNRNKGIIDRARRTGQDMSSRTNFQRGRAIRKQAKVEYGNQRFANRLQIGKKSIAEINRERVANGQAPLSAAQEAAERVRIARGSYARSMAKGLPGVRAAVASRIPNEAISGAAAGSSTAQVAAISRAAAGQVAKAMSDGVKAAMDQLKAEGISSDRGSLRNAVKATQDSVRAEAAAELLLQTAGTEDYGALLRDTTVMGKHGKAMVDAGLRSYSMIDTKSPDVADYITRPDAASTGAAGGAADGIDNAVRVMTLSGGKMIKYEPRAMARVFRRVNDPNVAPATRAEWQRVLQDQAQQAQQRPDFGDAKVPVQEAINQFAAGNFAAPPASVIPTGPNGPLPQNEW